MAKKLNKSVIEFAPAAYPPKRWTFNELPGWLQSESVDVLARILSLAERYVEQGWSKHEALVEAETELAGMG